MRFKLIITFFAICLLQAGGRALSVLHQCDLGRQTDLLDAPPGIVANDANQATMTARAWEGCTQPQNEFLDQALQKFQLLAKGAWKWYQAQKDPEFGADAQGTHTYWFGDIKSASDDDQESNAIFLEQVYKNAINGQNDHRKEGESARLGFVCDKIGEGSMSCKTDWRAFTPIKSEVTYVCPSFFDLSLNWKTLIRKDVGLAAGTIVHEITHSKRFIGIPDHRGEQINTKDQSELGDGGYGYDVCHNGANASTGPEDKKRLQSLAINNADNYKWYYQRAYNAYCCSSYEGDWDNPSPEKKIICDPFWKTISQEGRCDIF